jgi:hypothetical protein
MNVHRAATRLAHDDVRSSGTSVNAPPTTRAAAYLTDEVFLYRVVGFAESGPREMVEVEDCYRLDVVRAPLRDLQLRRLRVVTPARRR